MRKTLATLALIGFSGADPALSRDTSPHVSLEEGFKTPPDEARPRVWWHWLSGNVSQSGITKDLEWMKRTGVAGAMMFDGDMGAPKIVPERVTVLSPAWYENLRHAASEADRLGLEFAMAAAPGWSETGGPWVKPEMGMKKFVWSEKRVPGGRDVGVLPPLPSNPGPFLAFAKHDYTGKPQQGGVSLARDVAVLAFRAPKGDVPLSNLDPVVTTSARGVDAAAFTDGDVLKTVTLPDPTPDAVQWVRFDFDAPRTMRALTYVGPVGGRFAEGPQGRIEASDDGSSWRSLRTLVGPAHNPAPQRTFAFPATTARHFRVVFERGVQSREPYPRAQGLALAELALVPGARVDMFEDRAGFGVLSGEDGRATPVIDPGATVSSSGILDLTARLRGDGTLDWRPPPGEWIIFRAGWSLTGEVNHPATPEGTGLEVDKFNGAHVRAHLDAYLEPVLAKLGGLAGARGLRYLLTDSWEAGQENWTEAMPSEFLRRRGYDPLRMLPVLAGHVVDDADRSDAFLWDFRRTLADLVADNHYGTITAFAKEHGLGYYGEATGAAWPTVADGMLAKSRTDIPMGEFWAMPFGGRPAAYHQVPTDEFPADVIETRSTAHVYGKPLIAAEALTSSLPQWTATPWTLKWVADRYMAMGVNRLVLHTSPHQPDDTHRPGLTLGPFGQVFTRHETWADMAKPWIDYLSRGSFLLQQGTPVADVLYFYGEGAPSGVPYDRAGQPADLREHGFDYVNADALMRLARVVDGRITFPGGASYRLLVLPRDTTRMTLPLIERLRDLVAAGAVMVGPKPASSPSLASESGAVRDVADRLWGQADGRSLTVNSFGKGRVYWLDDVHEALKAEQIRPDMQAQPSDPTMDLRFAHRRVDDADVYFVTNQSAVAATVPVRFRVSGRRPERWDAADGSREAISYRMLGDVTEVDLPLAAYEAAFIVFRQPARAPSLHVPPAAERILATIGGTWDFSAVLADGTKVATTAGAGSWTEAARADLRYHSGTATYSSSIRYVRGSRRAGERIMLDLGKVGDLAEVRVNGNLAGTAWKPPYRVDVTDVLRSGSNRVEIKVANTWQNRLVGDLQPGATPRAWTNKPAGGGFAQIGGVIAADTPLTPSGLLETVRMIAISGAER